ncbi:zinc finger transcriptional factor charlatan [Brevipalpus obovatus]|uniref:zinc finger transcriptional factor charlatan n=1 Tax=Brevipalpus obovatus TaxID=246614 RepID=UPI003D9EBD06
MTTDWRLQAGFGGPVFPGMISPSASPKESSTSVVSVTMNNSLNSLMSVSTNTNKKQHHNDYSIIENSHQHLHTTANKNSNGANNSSQSMSTPTTTTTTTINDNSSNGHVRSSLFKSVPGRLARGSANSKHTLSRCDIQNAKKRYTCNQCQYSTDRRDLYRRHENIHRDEKPFHCYVCNKMFNRADHVKKHFLRIHKGLDYNVKLIKRIQGVDFSSPNDSLDNTTVNINSNNSNFHSNYPTNSSDSTSLTSICHPINGHLTNNSNMINGDINNNNTIDDHHQSSHHQNTTTAAAAKIKTHKGSRSLLRNSKDKVSIESKKDILDTKHGLLPYQESIDGINIDNLCEFIQKNRLFTRETSLQDIAMQMLKLNGPDEILLEASRTSTNFQDSLKPILKALSLSSGPLSSSLEQSKESTWKNNHPLQNSQHHSSTCSDQGAAIDTTTVAIEENFPTPCFDSQIKNHSTDHSSHEILQVPSNSCQIKSGISSPISQKCASYPNSHLIFNTPPCPRKTDWIHRLNPVRVEHKSQTDHQLGDDHSDVNDTNDSDGSLRCSDKNGFTKNQESDNQHCVDEQESRMNFTEETDEEDIDSLSSDDDDEIYEAKIDSCESEMSSSQSEISDCSHQCEFCGCAFVNLSSLLTHRFLLHHYLISTEICYPYSCVFCGKCRPTRKMMIRHMETHIKPKVRYYRLVSRKTYKIPKNSHDLRPKVQENLLISINHRRKQMCPRKVVKSPLKILTQPNGHLMNHRSSRKSTVSRNLSSKKFSIVPKGPAKNSNDEESGDENMIVEEKFIDRLGKKVAKRNEAFILRDSSSIDQRFNCDNTDLRTAIGYLSECKLCHRPFSYDDDNPLQTSSSSSSHCLKAISSKCQDKLSQI